jgi:hypothetical protein
VACRTPLREEVCALGACMKRVLRAAFLLALTLAVCVTGTVGQEVERQYRAKAKFLVIVAGFVEWPVSAFKTPTAPLQICLKGDFRFGPNLVALTQSANVGGRRMEVKGIRKEQDLPNCQILFVSQSDPKRYEKVLEAVQNSFTVTIGEDPAFLNAGGMMSLQTVGNGVSFDVNLDAENGGHLKLSSQLLSLARHILHRTEAASS